MTMKAGILIVGGLLVLLIPLAVQLAINADIRQYQQRVQYLRKQIEVEEKNLLRLQAENIRQTSYERLGPLIAERLPQLAHPTPSQLVRLEEQLQREAIDIQIENGLLTIPLAPAPSTP